jgi:ABC-type nitrate/sulfonate/bicarbonate transport system permease component
MAFGEMVASGEWLADVWASLSRYVLGLAFGWISGVAAGLLTGRVPLMRDSLGLLLNYFRSTPLVALVPFALIWLGIGEEAKVAVVAWGVLFPVWLNTHSGVGEVEREYVWAAQSLGATGWRLFWEVHLPRALPFVLAGTRMAIATGFFALAAAEMAGAYQGVAMRIFRSQQMFRTDKMLVAVLTIGAMGVLGDWLFLMLARWLFPWWQRGETAS